MSDRRVLIFLIIAIGFVLGINNLSGRSLWTDEFFTLFQSTGHGTIQKTLDNFSSNKTAQWFKARDFKTKLNIESSVGIKDINKGLLEDIHPPLYFWIMYFWISKFGNTVLAIRLFSVLMGLIGILLVYRIGIFLFNRKIALFSALFVSISSYAVRYSQEVRSYGLIMILCILSALFVLKLERHYKFRYLLGFLVVNALGFYTHYFYILFSLALLVYFTISNWRNDQLRRRFYLYFLASLMLFIPWVFLVVNKGLGCYGIDWPFGYHGIWDKIYYFFIGISHYILLFSPKNNNLNIVFLLGVSVLLIFLIYISQDMRKRYPKQFLFCSVITLLPIINIFLTDIIFHGILLRQERFWFFSFLGAIFFMGYALNCVFLKNRVLFFGLVFLLISASMGSTYYRFGPEPKNLSHWINKESLRHRALVVTWNLRSVVAGQSYYLDDNIYMMPVANSDQFNNSLEGVRSLADRIFVIRHFYRDDPSLMDKGLIVSEEGIEGFRLQNTLERDNIEVREYVKCVL